MTKTFEEIRAAFPHYTAVDADRQKVIYNLVISTKDLGGHMAEIGVYKGGTSHLIANTDDSRHLYSCDTFTGLPEPLKGVDTHSKGDFNDTSYEAVKELLNYPNVTVIKGEFPDSDLHKDLLDKMYSFVHIDVDLYEPTLNCLDFFGSRMTPGGIIVIDDYKMPSCPGVVRAVSDWTHCFTNLEFTFIDTGHKSCYFIKK